MTQFPLTQGAYQARGVIANAQNCVNLVPEPNPKDAPFPMSHYPAPGLTMWQDLSPWTAGAFRGLYFTSNGRMIAAIGQNIYRITGTTPTLLGTLPTNSGQPVSMCDNGSGNSLVIVDGTAGGWTVPLTSIDNAGSMTAISDPAFYGSNFVDYIDTFLVFNQPGGRGFYTTTSNVLTPFNPLYFANKEGWNDVLVCARCLHDNIWLLGNETTEVWFNAGAAAGTSFPFARMPNTVLQQGCVAAYSAVIADNAIYWLSQDRWGRSMMMRGEGYTARRVSNFAQEQIWNNYPYVGDCVGMAFQYAGHETIGWYFPTAQAWWVYDAATQQFHQRTYNGLTQPWLAYCTAYWGTVAGIGEANGLMVGSRLGPQLFYVDRNGYTDGGVPITRQRAWPHAVNDGKRQHYARFSAAFDGSALSPDTVALDWSDDGGHTFGTPVLQSCGNATNGQFQWRRLGYARDRVFRMTWSGSGEATLNGAFVDAVPMGT